MKKKFRYSISTDINQLIVEAKKLASENKITMVGDEKGGYFVGKEIDGEYLINNRSMEVIITKKPAIYSWQKIDTLLQGFFC